MGIINKRRKDMDRGQGNQNRKMKEMPPEEVEEIMRMMRKAGNDPRMMEMGEDMMGGDMMDMYGEEDLEHLDPAEREVLMLQMMEAEGEHGEKGKGDKANKKMRMMQMGMMGRFGRFGGMFGRSMK